MESNYEAAKKAAAQYFLNFDQEEIIAKPFVKSDETYLYLDMFDTAYRISKNSGLAEGSRDAFQNVYEADFNEAMTIYDLLCYRKRDAEPSFRYATLESLNRVYSAGKQLGTGFYQKTADYFDGHAGALKTACEILGGSPEGKGDISYRIPFFGLLGIVVSFWQSDDEFSADLSIMMDQNSYDFLHYETMYYVSGHLLARLEALAAEHEID